MDNSDICPKKQKLDCEINIKSTNLHETIKDLQDFINIEIISNNTRSKSVCLKGNFAGKDGIGLVILEKTAFSETDLKPDKYFVPDCYLEKVFSNDIYGNYRFFPKVELNDIKTTVIHPATEKHIVKYKQQILYIIDETPEIYKSITLPFLETEQFSLQWVYNILDGKSEAERVVYNDLDPEIGFVLLPDLKWDENKDTLYLLAIVRTHGVKSIRDLRKEHLQLLKNVRDKCCKLIENKYGINSSQLRIYFHYQPSFYHLHVHFCILKHDAPGIYAEKAHMLSNVISNLDIFPDYYQKVTIPFVVKETDNLFNILLDKRLLRKIE